MAALENAQFNTNSMQRVKVYRLNEDGNWDDRGTGLVSMDYMERSQELGLYVIDEDDNETLLVHRISTEDIYRKQEDTIISWRDPERSIELALSFQETAGCSHVWNQIAIMQRNLHFSSLNSEPFHNVNYELRELPDVELSTLPLIHQIVTETDQMRLTQLMLKDVDFFGNLMGVFEICEESNNVDDLHMIFNIVNGIISLNSSQILEKIFGDKLIMQILGCLEYDPNVPQPQHHRKYLREHVVLKEAIPIKDPLVLSKIHQIYIIGYLKDFVLAGVLNDAIKATIKSVIDAIKATVVTRLKDDSTLIQELFATLRSPTTSVDSRNNLVYFLHEFCSLSKSLQLAPQLRLFRELMNKGIFYIIAEVLQSPDKKLVATGIDILFFLLTPDPNLLRSYVVRPETCLLSLLVKGMMEDFGDQFLEVFRIILDSNALSGGAQRANIMDIFCEKHLPELVDFITASCPKKPGDISEGASGRVDSKTLLNICELLCFCVQQDSSRTIFLIKNVAEKVLLLTQRKEKPVVAAAIRFFRTLLSVRDDNVDSYVVENNMLKPVIDVLVGGANRDNLLTSTILELLEHIRKVPISHPVLHWFLRDIPLYMLQFCVQGNSAVLLKYVVDTLWDQLASFEHLASIQEFRTKYKQCLESREPKSTTVPVDMGGNERALDKQEDNDVKKNRDEEKPASASSTQKEEANPRNSNVAAASSAPPRSGGLVDYEDDEDGQETHPKKEPEASEEEKERELLRLKNKNSPCSENEQQQCHKKPRLCSTIEGNKNSAVQGGEAKEPENSRSSNDDGDSLDEDNDSKTGTADKGEDDASALTHSESSTEMDTSGS